MATLIPSLGSARFDARGELRLAERLKDCLEDNCRIPDDSISPSRFPLFLARDVMRLLIDGLHASAMIAERTPT